MKTESRERVVRVPIVASGRHCDATCGHLQQFFKECNLFFGPLLLDYAADRFKRLPACIKAEVKE